MSARKRSSFASNSDGGAAIEFAIMGPVTILAVLGIFCGGWAFHSASSVRYGLAEASRALQMDPDLSTEALTEIVKRQSGPVLGDIGSVSLVWGEPDGTIRLATTSVNYILAFDFPFLPPIHVDFQTSVTVPIVSS